MFTWIKHRCWRMVDFFGYLEPRFDENADDNTEAVQVRLKKCGVCRIPAGTYRFESTVVMSGNTKLVGMKRVY